MEIIAELERHKRQHFNVKLVVALEKTTELISGNAGTARDRVERLNAYIDQGGEAIGFIAWTLEDETGAHWSAAVWLMQEYEQESWAKEHLVSLLATFQDILEKKRIIAPSPKN